MSASATSSPPCLLRTQLTLAALAVCINAVLLIVLAVWVLQEHHSASLLLALDDPLQVLRPADPARTPPVSR